jgi:hypothetical protein
MKILSRRSIRLINKITTISKKQTILNFITAHPRLTAILAGLGISIVFSFLGRFFVHEALATTTTSTAASALPLTYDPQDGATSAATTTPSFQVDYIDKTPISNVPGHVTNVFFACKCDGCGASEFAPGKEAISPGDAHNLAPGQEAQNSEGEFTAKDLAPGQEFKKGIK